MKELATVKEVKTAWYTNTAIETEEPRFHGYGLPGRKAAEYEAERVARNALNTPKHWSKQWRHAERCMPVEVYSVEVTTYKSKIVKRKTLRKVSQDDVRPIRSGGANYTVSQAGCYN